ncbi:hypothetical protein PABG_00206 [Paracoccidioides brasiliensis Pb03]|nr:hypothetical protein PABG_00206 [Paracoccidioides brasiliensis Pb03]
MTGVFKNHIIALSGTFPGYKQAVLIDRIESGGGAYTAKVVDTCTHLVTTQKEVDDNKPKCKQAALIKDLKIVSLDWLLDSAADGNPATESPYLLTATTASPTAAGNGRPLRSSRAKLQLDGSNVKPSVDADDDDKPANDVKPSNGKKNPANSKTKRTLAADDEDASSKSQDEPPAKKQKYAQRASSPTLQVPVDENYPHRSTHEVFIDDKGLIYDAALNQTHSTYNNNKFYLIQLLVNKTSGKYTTWTRWGRVGENGQNAAFSGLTLDQAKATFDKKFRNKTGLSWSNRLDPPRLGRYTFIERNYEEDASDGEDADQKKTGKKVKKEDEEEMKLIECTLPEPVQKFVGLIFNQQHMLSTMASMSYDAKKLPLGKLSKRTLMMGFAVLKELSELVADPTIAMQKYGRPFVPAAEQLSNQYFTLIPHVFGRHRPPVIGSQDIIKREVDLLETLTDMEIANEIMKDAKASENGVHYLDMQYQGLGLQEMSPLDPATAEYRELEDYLVKSHGHTHHLRYRLEHIFRVERHGEKERFEASPFAHMQNTNRRLLWHGSRSTNYGGILSQGLRIAPPEAPVTGYMFGKGIYFADISSKSANYCWPNSSGKIGILMLCDVELGDPMLELVNSDYNAGENAKKQGSLSTLGKGQTVPQGWKDAGCVHESLKGALMPDVKDPPKKQDNTDVQLQYNEYIVYDVAQIRVKYLLYVHMS